VIVTQPMVVSDEPLIPSWARGFTPPPLLTVSAWADAKRFLPTRSNAQGARWNTDRVPYLRGVMDAVLEPGVKKIVFMKAAQIGGSEAVNNIIGYFIEHDPCPMMLVQPTEDVAEKYSKERLADMILGSEALQASVDDTESTLTMKMFVNGFLVLGGANTPNTFARWSVRLAMGDDIDRWPPIVGEDGDPIALLGARTTMYDDGIVMLVSTPTVMGGRIDSAFGRSDQRRFFVACPNCDRRDYIVWKNPNHFHVRWDERDATSARLECPDRDHGGCGEHLDEAERRRMVAAGQWRATATALDPGTIGFHAPAMVTTLGNASLETWVGEWLSAQGLGKESLRVFINTRLAEGWEEKGAQVDSHALMKRREPYGAGVEIPGHAVAVTAGVDVQENRFEVHVFAWGLAEERWLIDVNVVPGNPRNPETKSQLLHALSRKYTHALGPLLPIHAVCIDTGFLADEIYDFVLAHQARRIFATKGFAGRAGGPIVGNPSEVRSGKSPRPVRLYPINVDDAKRNVMDSIVESSHGPGCCHFPDHLDAVGEEYFAQLCAERREDRHNRYGVKTHFVWVQDRDRNEALDGAVMALAAYRLLNPNIRQMHEALAASARLAPAPAPSVTSGAPAGMAATRQRRVAQSPYLNP
jgi:phage terminase large subunit GpA-like protein